jgi:hypothetical protein
MKKLKISLLALSVLAGGSLVASAAAPIVGNDYTFDAIFTNPTPTSIFSVDGTPIPDPSSTVTVEEIGPGGVNTDGAGKIDGATTLRIGFLNASSNLVAVADMVTTVSGSIVTKGTTPTATINLKGNGSSVDSTGVVGTCNMSLKFVGSPTNLTATGFDLPIKGTFSGTVKTGLASINGGKPLKVDTTTTGSASGSGNPVELFGRVIQNNTKLYIVANDLDGTGSVNTKKQTYTSNLKGFGSSKGSSVTLSGNTTVKTNVWFQFGTNPPVSINVGVPATANAKGKAQGQSVNATGGIVLLNPGF